MEERKKEERKKGRKEERKKGRRKKEEGKIAAMERPCCPSRTMEEKEYQGVKEKEYFIMEIMYREA